MGIKFISKVLLAITLTFSSWVNAFEIDYHDDLLEENLFLCLEKGDKYCSDLALDLYKNNNLNEALRLNEALCSQNWGPSCNLLGEMHYFGKGASLDYEKAFNYFQKGCELSDGASCRNYALRKFQSSVIFGTDHNSQKMTELLDLGCAYNDALSCSFIKDYDKACKIRDYLYKLIAGLYGFIAEFITAIWMLIIWMFGLKYVFKVIRKILTFKIK